MNRPTRIVLGALAVGALTCSASLLTACVSKNSAGGSDDASFPDGAQFEAGDDSSVAAEASDDATAEAAPVDASPPLDGSTPVDAGKDATTHDAAPDAAPEAASPEASTADASPADAGLDAGAEAGADAGSGIVYWVDPVNGLDTNPGTQGMPFQSIRQAEIVIDGAANDGATSPFTVMLASGTYSAANQPGGLIINFQKHVVSVKASSPGAAVIQGAGAGEYMIFTLGGGVQNVKFQGTQYGAEGLAGTFVVSGCTFDSQTGWGAAFVGTTIGTIDTSVGGGFANVASGSAWGIYVDQTAQVTWNGGGTTTVNGTGSAVGSDFLFMRSGAQLSISGVTITSFPSTVGLLYDQAKLTMTNVTVTGSGLIGAPGSSGAFVVGGSQSGAPAPTISLFQSSITASQGNAFAYQTATNTATMTFNATGSHIDGNTYGGLWVSGLTGASLVVNVNVNGSTFDNNGFFGISAVRGAVTFTGTGNDVSGNGASAAGQGQTPGGIVMTDAASTQLVSLRNVKMANNVGNFVSLTGGSSSTLDLGTAGSPGGNVFSGVGSGASALNLQATIAGSAVGNTWMPSVQGASAAGLFPAGTTLTGPQSGQNVTMQTGASVLMTP